MGAYLQLTRVGVSTRMAAVLTGVSRATATRAKATARPTDPAPRTVPANKLSLAERTTFRGLLQRLAARANALDPVESPCDIVADVGSPG